MSRALWCTAAAALLLGACGEAPQLGLVTSIRVEGLMRDEVSTINIYVCGPKRSDGIFLPCSSLMIEQIEPTDERVELLAQKHIGLADSPDLSHVTLSVAPGAGRVVYVEANGNNDLIVANDCKEGVTVDEGKSTPVEDIVLRRP